MRTIRTPLKPGIYIMTKKCSKCGGNIIFRNINGGIIPIHLSGHCTTSQYRTSRHYPQPKTYRTSYRPTTQSIYNDQSKTTSSHPQNHSTTINYPSPMPPSPTPILIKNLNDDRENHSYVHNATCPICLQPVYFCELENGGRVYFDQLGKPWPKHPCTDTPRHLSNSARRLLIRFAAGLQTNPHLPHPKNRAKESHNKATKASHLAPLKLPHTCIPAPLTNDTTNNNSQTEIDKFLVHGAIQPNKNKHTHNSLIPLTTSATQHNIICGNLFAFLHAQLRNRPCYVFFTDIKLHINAVNAIFYPDLLVTCSATDRPEGYTIREPSIVVEVLSPVTAAYDHGAKFVAYRQLPSLREYVLIDPDRILIHAFHRNEDGHWTFLPYTTGETMELSSLGIQVPVAEIYAGTETSDP